MASDTKTFFWYFVYIPHQLTDGDPQEKTKSDRN